MSNWMNYELDVHSNSFAERKGIADRLKYAFPEFPKELAFNPKPNDDYRAESCSKSWSSFNNFSEIGYLPAIRQRVIEISQAYPDVVFLLAYSDYDESFAAKEVLRAGIVFCNVHTANQDSEPKDWLLPDIFAPYRAEIRHGVPFGTLFDDWLRAMSRTVARLQEQRSNQAVSWTT